MHFFEVIFVVKAREVDAGAVVNVDVLVRAVAAFFVTLCVINTAHVSLKMSGRLLLETGPDDGMVHTRYGKNSGTAPPCKSLSEYFNKCRRDDVFLGRTNDVAVQTSAPSATLSFVTHLFPTLPTVRHPTTKTSSPLIATTALAASFPLLPDRQA